MGKLPRGRRYGALAFGGRALGGNFRRGTTIHARDAVGYRFGTTPGVTNWTRDAMPGNYSSNNSAAVWYGLYVVLCSVVLTIVLC